MRYCCKVIQTAALWQHFWDSWVWITGSVGFGRVSETCIRGEWVHYYYKKQESQVY